MNRAGIYLYCFARAGSIGDLPVHGVDGRGEIHVLEAEGLAAVCSLVDLEEFQGDSAEQHLGELAWLAPRVCEHQKVIEEVQRRSVVLPVRFGTVFRSEEALEAVTRSRREEISGFLDRVADKEEWAVKGFVESARTAESLLATDAVLMKMAQEVPQAPGARYFHEQRLRAEVQKRSTQWRLAMAAEVRERLQALALDARPLRIQPRSVTGCSSHMVLNRAFLLLRSRVDEFRQQVERLNGRHQKDGLRLELTGPWPPYNFCDVMKDLETSRLLHP